MPTLSETLRKAMDDSGETLYRIAKESGIAYPVLYRFYHHERELRLPTATKLADYLALELRPKRKRKK